MTQSPDGVTDRGIRRSPMIAAFGSWLVVRSRGLGSNLMAGLRSLGGGEIHEYTALLEETRHQAIDRLVANAAAMGANAIISMRFDSSSLADYMSEIVAYGTGVVIVPEPGAGLRLAE